MCTGYKGLLDSLVVVGNDRNKAIPTSLFI